MTGEGRRILLLIRRRRRRVLGVSCDVAMDF
jgi:hypothetical protein